MDSKIEIEEIKIEREVLRRRTEALNERERELYKQERDADILSIDTTLKAEDIKPEEINYVLGASKGYVDGYQAAINTIIEALSNEYRDIPMTEDELHMITELGKIHELAWLKDHKQKRVVEKAGWKFDYTLRCPIWVKEAQDEQEKR